jgi:hypothetical protein
MSFKQQATPLEPFEQLSKTPNSELDICLLSHYKSALKDILFLMTILITYTNR